MLLYCGISFSLLLSIVNTNEQTESGYNCCSPSQGEQKVALDYGDGSNDIYGIPKDFTMPDLTAVTMCAWVKHRRRLGSNSFSSYLSYKTNTNGTDVYDLLGFYGRQGSTEGLNMFVDGKYTNLNLPLETSIHDDQWHSVCASWSSFGGLFFRSYDKIIDTVSAGFQENYTIPGGGELVICQRWAPGGFFPKRHCHGEIGGVEMWDYYSDSNKIRCVNNCWSVGKLFHFNWTEMLPQGNMLRLNRTEHICDGEIMELTLNTSPECSSNTVLYVVSGVQGAVNLLLMIFIGYMFRTDILGFLSKTDPGYDIPLCPTVHPVAGNMTAEHNNQRVQTSSQTMDETTMAEDYMTPVSSPRNTMTIPDQYVEIGARHEEPPNTYDKLNFAHNSTYEEPSFYDEVGISDNLLDEGVTKSYENVNL